MEQQRALPRVLPRSAVLPGSDEVIRLQYEEFDAWGMHSAIDLHECDGATIRDADAVKRFVYELCERIGMRRFGECTVVDFGDDPKVTGFSVFQLIETSNISCHVANQTNAMYWDIFSCKYYDPYVVAEFAKEYFEAKDYTLNHLFRK